MSSFAEREAEDDGVGELDGEGGAFFKGRPRRPRSADLGAEGVAVFGLAEGYGEVGQEDGGPGVESEFGVDEAELEVASMKQMLLSSVPMMGVMSMMVYFANGMGTSV